MLLLDAIVANLYGKACRPSLSISQRSGTHFPQLLNLWAIPKEMPLLQAEVASFGSALFIRLLHLFQPLGLYPTFLLQFLQLLFLGHHGD